jgi:hypothetical protein
MAISHRLTTLTQTVLRGLLIQSRAGRVRLGWSVMA